MAVMPQWLPATWLLTLATSAFAADEQQVTASVVVLVDDLPSASRRLFTLLEGAEQTTDSTPSSVTSVVTLAPEEAERLLDAVAALGRVTQRELVRTAQLATCADRRRWIEKERLLLEGAKPGSADEMIRLADSLRAHRQEAAAMEECVSSRSTVTISLGSAADAVQRPPGVEPRFFPGARFSHLLDASGTGTSGLFGIGLSVQLADVLTFEVELFRSVTALGGREGADAFLFSAGLDVPSELLGAGKRTFLNPHLGVRLGVSSMWGRVDLAAGVTVGLELVHLRALRIDAQVRAIGLLGNSAGPHLGLQSGITVAVGF